MKKIEEVGARINNELMTLVKKTLCVRGSGDMRVITATVQDGSGFSYMVISLQKFIMKFMMSEKSKNKLNIHVLFIKNLP